MPVELSIDQQALQALGRALRSEEDGKQLRRELSKNIRKAAEPALLDARSNLMAVTTLGGTSASPPLRATILPQMKAQARLSGRTTGARVRVRKRGPRGFEMAARRLNRAKGWRHPLFGRPVWVRQIARPVRWFDEAMQNQAAEYRAAVLAAMEDMARRIAARTGRH